MVLPAIRGLGGLMCYRLRLGNGMYVLEPGLFTLNAQEGSLYTCWVNNKFNSQPSSAFLFGTRNKG